MRSVGPGGFDGASRLALPVFEDGSWDVGDRDRVSSVLHGLYWLTSDLADQRPLALIIDDAQSLDAASARFLTYLAGRLEGSQDFNALREALASAQSRDERSEVAYALCARAVWSVS